jgi:hypothetical protein
MKQLNIILLGIIISLLVCQQFMRNPYRKDEIPGGSKKPYRARWWQIKQLR